MLCSGSFQKITPAHALAFFGMSHKYAPAPATAPSPAADGFTCVTHKWLMPLDIRPSHSFAFVGMCHTHAPTPEPASLCSRLQPCHLLMLS
ncbi:hypothetical protein O181_033618 [Austropuccinia psidii MF-1]|uniref:Uncharacterized protein n=1 Tax=Austropuccinia psidii MF-1 TaxID=1389203 RepID=A0A9Q3D3X0_9BASI|nr:hypothetical protein [Austropuccinia psidii MF-1]